MEDKFADVHQEDAEVQTEYAEVHQNNAEVQNCSLLKLKFLLQSRAVHAYP